ncbi:MAG: phosphoribosylformylglycinamidine cyclo-ligase [Hydrotalea flava]|uniref:AIR synthase related protein n=1 Tax=Hydrotalea TaxID=1004300 RepID=UPI00094230D9|nr:MULTISPECIES: AIR synthase related protein [Hydrotalea]MBY0347734.1 phosphoribosylformylglycinamidine cyclo-ligase [Hydrotalea flava]NIM35818.1 phosphoribosylformylglycinamidine cyclo-ligase [Hydrotalea flava]NIM38670.1 phosphoribosylformylglycinamidine cyclo-ligase [Hydrotalea flava]NIN03858.1 phosphoribosylformylglycinamidine cyclo-ligase [Hydrotalea flava]NIN15579.1 phosphoribosylformylglycinamidine cyclo-ligase [Hydrotalea flava]
MSLYAQRGVSAQKEEIHQAIKNLNQGLYANAFCKIYPDYLGGDEQMINVSHADGAGTKSILAYLYWKETGNTDVWKGIAQDAVAMNIDDLLCIGIYDKMIFASTIDRNKHLIDGAIIEQLINGTQHFFNQLAAYGIHIHYLGGETADVGDVVRTIAVNGTIAARWPKNKLITNNKIDAGNVIVGFASSGQATYETTYNSGLGSNGLTSARHDVLSKWYAQHYPETFEPTLPDDVVYIGNKRLTDTIAIDEKNYTVGQLLLSPTRTYAPLVKQLLEQQFEDIYGIIHCSGGGQTKCMKYLPRPLKVVKNNLLPIPIVFQLIQQNSGADNKEMFQVFNMGHRLEVFTNEKAAQQMIATAAQFNIEAAIIGHTEAARQNELFIQGAFGSIQYTY